VAVSNQRSYSVLKVIDESTITHRAQWAESVLWGGAVCIVDNVTFFIVTCEICVEMHYVLLEVGGPQIANLRI
jgi:hypothetical protein